MKWIFEKLGIHSREDFFDFIKQLFKFGIVGVSNTAISLGVYYLFLLINPELYMVGSVLGTILSIANAFFWNNKYVFTGNDRDLKSTLKRLGKTYLSYGGTALLSNLLLLIEVSLLGVPKNFAPIINLFITTPINFLINKFWTFKRK